MVMLMLTACLFFHTRRNPSFYNHSMVTDTCPYNDPPPHDPHHSFQHANAPPPPFTPSHFPSTSPPPQVSKLDTDPASHSARASAQAPAKLQAPRSPTAFRKQDYAWWHGEWSPPGGDVPRDGTLLQWYGGPKQGGDEAVDADHTAEACGVATGSDTGDVEVLEGEPHTTGVAQHDVVECVGDGGGLSTPVAATSSLTLSQVDPAVLAELPPAMQQELLSALRRSALANLANPRQARPDTMLAASPRNVGGASRTPRSVDQHVDRMDIDYDVLRQLPMDIRMEVEASMGACLENVDEAKQHSACPCAQGW